MKPREDRPNKMCRQSPPTVGPMAGATAVISVLNSHHETNLLWHSMINMRGRAKPPISLEPIIPNNKAKLGAINDK